MNAANKIILKINVTTAGSYSISVPGTNGYGFFVKDSLTTTGEQLITLPAIGGAPVYGTINTFNISTQGNTCTFAISVEGGELPGVLDDNDHMYFGNPGNAAINLDSVNNFLMRRCNSAIGDDISIRHEMLGRGSFQDTLRNKHRLSRRPSEPY